MPIPAQPGAPTTEESFSMAELALATRNHGMPLEAMRWDVTPPGLHYVLTHFDIPALDPDAWRLEVGGAVATAVTVDLAGLQARDQVDVTTTMECAGNGRALLSPRAVSQPWLLEAVGTARWTGAALNDLIDEAGIDDDAVELVFTGADRGLEGGIVQSYQRALTVAEARSAGAVVAHRMNDAPLPPQHGHPARLVVPGWYGMASVKWLIGIAAVTEPHHGYQDAVGLPATRGAVGARAAGQPDRSPLPVDPARDARLPLAPAPGGRRRLSARGEGLVGTCPGRCGRGERRRRGDLAPGGPR